MRLNPARAGFERASAYPNREVQMQKKDSWTKQSLCSWYFFRIFRKGAKRGRGRLPRPKRRQERLPEADFVSDVPTGQQKMWKVGKTPRRNMAAMRLPLIRGMAIVPMQLRHPRSARR